MKKHILIYGICGGLLIVVLKLIEYRFLVIERSIEIYGGLIALLFASVGIWLGLKLTKNKETVVVKEVPVEVTVEVPVPTREPFVLDQIEVATARHHRARAGDPPTHRRRHEQTRDR